MEAQLPPTFSIDFACIRIKVRVLGRPECNLRLSGLEPKRDKLQQKLVAESL